MNAAAAALYQQGMAAFDSGDLHKARTLFRQATEADTKAHQAFFSLGVVQQRLRDDGAMASYQRAFSLKPDYERAMVAYGLLMAQQGNTSEADRFLTEKRGRLPKSAAIVAALAEVKSISGDTGAAQRIAQEALKLDPDHRPAMVTIARDHYRNRRLDLSLYALKANLDGFDESNPPRDKNNAEAHMIRALIWAEQGFRHDAMQAFRRTLELRPDLMTARLHLATYLLESGGAHEALPLLEKAIYYDRDHLGAHLSLGDAYRLLGRYGDAKRELEWVLGRDASLPEVHYNLGLLYLFAPEVPGMTPKAQVEAAMAELRKYKELQRKGDPEDADELLNRAMMKKTEIEALEQAKQPVAPPTPAATGAADAGVIADGGGGDQGPEPTAGQDGG